VRLSHRGTSDAISRRIADKLRGGYATNVVVENKPGAGGQIAVTTLRDSAADGSVMLLTPSSMLSIYPFTYPKLPYKPLEDLQPVSMACTFNHAFGVGPCRARVRDELKGFLAWAKDNPDKANYGSPAADPCRT
jgi:tripartite-type tricarboxylate transporter receptor subunit TctC